MPSEEVVIYLTMQPPFWSDDMTEKEIIEQGLLHHLNMDTSTVRLPPSAAMRAQSLISQDSPIVKLQPPVQRRQKAALDIK